MNQQQQLSMVTDQEPEFFTWQKVILIGIALICIVVTYLWTKEYMLPLLIALVTIGIFVLQMIWDQKFKEPDLLKMLDYIKDTDPEYFGMQYHLDCVLQNVEAIRYGSVNWALHFVREHMTIMLDRTELSYKIVGATRMNVEQWTHFVNDQRVQEAMAQGKISPIMRTYQRQ